MNSIEPFASEVPYMVTEGNHEYELDNSREAFEKRFKMPGNTRNQWYSVTAGPAKFIAFTGELLMENDEERQKEQMDFLKKEL